MRTTRRTVRIEWGHCDPAGIVYFPRYLEFFDACTAALFESVGLPKPQLIERYDIIGVPMVDLHAKFSAPSRFGEDVVIESGVSEWGRSSFKVHHRLLKGETVAVECWETRVWAGRRRADDPNALEARPIPADVIQLLS